RAERLKNPDRIVFDLPGTQLASVLVGKSFDVEDGFLKRIRVAQYHAADARIVLEVDDLANYSAFLLPNPSRLVIDLHGDPPSAEALKNFSTRPNTENAVAAEDDESSSLQAQDSSDDLASETETAPHRKEIEARSAKNKIISAEPDEDRTE